MGDSTLNGEEAKGLEENWNATPTYGNRLPYSVFDLLVVPKVTTMVCCGSEVQAFRYFVPCTRIACVL